MLSSLCFSCMTIEARHLRSFLAIADAGSITRAAASLHVSQPALSRTLTQLERDLGVQLVVRSTHHLQLTDAGKRFRAAATKGLKSFDQAIASVAVDVTPLRFGHTWASATHTAAIARAWTAAHPHRALQLLRGEDRTAGLEGGDVDIALTRGPIDDPALRTLTLDDEARVAVLPAGHPLARRKRVRLADLADQPLIVHTTAGMTTPRLWPAGSRPRVGREVTTTDDWLIAIATGIGVGVSVVSTAELRPHPDVRYVPLVDAPTVPLMLVWPVSDPHPYVGELIRIAQRAIEQRHRDASH
ncbi:MAG: LysR family transcriptional regulator [Ilumatobacteraceae bacterium]|nr:LysR family transcriptional regulator [Ilumatobacteraceae bacterium]